MSHADPFVRHISERFSQSSTRITKVAIVLGWQSHESRIVIESLPTRSTLNLCPLTSMNISTRAEKPSDHWIPMSNLPLSERASEFVGRTGRRLEKLLGQGQDGIVWLSDQGTAVKTFERPRNHHAERQCYQRLEIHSITNIRGFAIPALIGFCDELMVVEMDLVQPPYLLDFGKAYLDREPDFSAEIWSDWENQRRELFEDRWPQVRLLVSALRRIGIYYMDAKPGNIMFGDEHLE